MIFLARKTFLQVTFFSFFSTTLKNTTPKTFHFRFRFFPVRFHSSIENKLSRARVRLCLQLSPSTLAVDMDVRVKGPTQRYAPSPNLCVYVRRSNLLPGSGTGWGVGFIEDVRKK